MHGAIAAKILWREGMHLAQHHFQSQSRYVEDCIATALSHSFFTPYGLAGCELDRDALRNGTAALLVARGLMSDGTPFQMPDGDPLPKPRDIRDAFSPASDSHRLLLTLPAYQPTGANLGTDGTQARFRAITQVQRDDLTGADEKSVTLAGRNFRLTLDSEASEHDVSLSVALIRRDGKGGFQYDPEYIPPSLQIGASEPLSALVQRMIDVLDARGDAIALNRGSAAPAEFASREVANFWLLHAIQSAVAVLRHHATARRIHPEQLYLELARLSGALCTFALESHPRDLPLYDHEDLAGCLGRLHDHIRAHLELIVPTSLITVPLAISAPSLHTGAIPDRRAFSDASWILGIKSSAGAADTIGRAPRLLKVCSAKFTLELVKRQFPGLTLTHLPVPPSPIVPRAETQYFSITRSGPCWDTLQQTNEIGVYVPDALPNASVELAIILGIGMKHGRLALTLQEVMTATVRLRAQRQVAADAASFREHVRHLLGIAEREALDSGYSGEDVRLALFAVVAFLDESVLNSANPMFVDWPRRPLQDEIFGGNVGGEAFFQQVRQLLVRQDSEQLADLLEIYQLCMLLGFHGRYSATESSDMQSLVAQVGSKIRRARGLVGRDSTTEISPSWRPPKDVIPARATDPWVRRLGITAAVAAIFAVALFVIYAVVLKAGGIKA